MGQARERRLIALDEAAENGAVHRRTAEIGEESSMAAGRMGACGCS
jgi:hypothetical protein